MNLGRPAAKVKQTWPTWPLNLAEQQMEYKQKKHDKTRSNMRQNNVDEKQPSPHQPRRKQPTSCESSLVNEIQRCEGEDPE